jgi:hypothetical protein
MEKNNIETIVKTILSEQTGADVEDIKMEDGLAEEMHLGPSEITDFLSKLEENGIETTNIENPLDLTVGELIDHIVLNS